MPKKLIYFGCIGSKGHFFFGAKGRQGDAAFSEFPGLSRTVFRFIDGAFTPGFTRDQGLYQINIVPPVMIVAWWDYTVDDRPGSNSNLIGMGYESAEEMIDAAYELYPSVMSRQPRPIKFELK